MPSKAKLATRSGTTANTSDNLSKGSKLTFDEMDGNFIGLRDQTFGVVADDSATLDVAAGDTLYIQGGSNVTTATDSAGVITINATSDVTNSSTTTFTNKSIDADNNTITNIEVDNLKSGVLDTDISSVAGTDTTLASAKAIKTYVDAEDANIASDTLEFTNKTFDANGTGNNISNIDIGNMTAAVIVTESEGISSNDNDTTIPTSAAVKDLVDNSTANTGDITFVGSTIISPSNADLTLNPAGTGKVNINAVYTLPNADGSADQVLGTNGSGVLSFRDPTAINIDGGVADSNYTSVPTIDGGTA